MEIIHIIVYQQLDIELTFLCPSVRPSVRQQHFHQDAIDGFSCYYTQMCGLEWPMNDAGPFRFLILFKMAAWD
jgi:hypothetical protein